MNSHLDTVRENLRKQVELRAAAQLVLDDWRERREQQQASWDRTEAGMRQNIEFYNSLIANLQGQFDALEHAETQEKLKRADAAIDITMQVLKGVNTVMESIAEAKSTETPPRGAITEAVETMLRYAKEPVAIPQLTDRLISKGLKSDRDEAAAAVRSTLKNLKKQGRVLAIGQGRYAHVSKLGGELTPA